MGTIHDEIDNWLAADLHGQLAEPQREALHAHLVECASCRRLHQESKTLHNVLEARLENARPDGSLEQRLLAGFRARVPGKSRSFGLTFFGLLDSRFARVAGIAAAIFFLIGVGRWLTSPALLYAGEELAVQAVPEPVPGSFSELRQRLVADEMPIDPRFRDLARGNRISLPMSAPAQSARAYKSKEDEAGPNPTLALNRDLVEKSGEEAATTAGYSADEGKPETAVPERVIVTGSNIPAAEEVGPNPSGETEAPPVSTALANRKLIRNATVDVEVPSFEDAVQKIVALTNETHGYIATTSSEKQSNGKLKGQITAKITPENLDRFLQSVRGLGELKNQTIGTEDITKTYFDTDARLKNSRVMEQRLVEMLKKTTGKVADLLQVEKELARVREEIEKMQGDIKFWDSQVQFATVTISLVEKDIEDAANFLLKEHAQLALYTTDVNKVYADIKALASPRVQITDAQIDRDNSGRASAKVTLLIVPEESEQVIEKVRAMGRVENFQVRTEREAQDGSGMSENARTRRDKVELSVTISRDEQEQALQQTSLTIRTGSVDEKMKQLRELAAKQDGRVRTSSFSRDPDGREFANVTVRVPVKNNSALLESLKALGKLQDVRVQRQERSDAQIDEPNAPADISIQIYNEGNLVSNDSGLLATLRHTISQGASALMWSLRMIGVAAAFFLPWVLAIVAVVFGIRRWRRLRNV